MSLIGEYINEQVSVIADTQSSASESTCTTNSVLIKCRINRCYLLIILINQVMHESQIIEIMLIILRSANLFMRVIPQNM